MDDVLLAGGFFLLVVLIVEQMKNSGALDIGTTSTDTGDSFPQEFSGDPGIVSTDMSTPGKLVQFADAIFHFEGGNPGDLNVRNNNPGNLKFAGQPAAIGKDAKGFAIFPSLDSGFSALYAQLTKTIGEFPQLNLQQFFARYLGQQDFLNPRATDQGDPFSYAQTVANKLGVSPTDSLGSIFGGV